MRKSIFELRFALFLLLIFQSCSNKDSYTPLSDQARELLVYDVGDTFMLRNLVTEELIEFRVDFKNIDYYKDTNPGNWVFGFGGDSYYEQGEYYFTDETTCYSGSVLVEARRDGNFDFTIGTGNCFCEFLSTAQFNSLGFKHEDVITSLNINGIEYPETYKLDAFSGPFINTIYYTKEKGIIQIYDDDKQSVVFELVE